MTTDHLWTIERYVITVYGIKAANRVAIARAYFNRCRTIKTAPTVAGVSEWMLEHEEKALHGMPAPVAWKALGATLIAEVEAIVGRELLARRNRSKGR
jgi:hypothetical protein